MRYIGTTVQASMNYSIDLLQAKHAKICFQQAIFCNRRRLTLPRFKAGVSLVNHVHTTFTSDYSTVPIPIFKRFQRVCDLHGTNLSS